MQSAVSSCPGKVLITGGYLILDRQYSGIVISLDAKFSTRVSYLDLSNSISVKSTQFLDPDIIYRIDYSDTIININSPIPSYVSKTLFYCLNIANHLATDSIIPILKLGISIEFTASDDFYSSDPNKCLLVDVRKTGLGSSAAMIASLVSSLFLYFNILSKDDIANKRLIHNVSQICHSIAQGKIGSGFDISAAVYGSHIYQRYSPSYIDQFLSNPMSDNWLKEFHKIAFETWDCIVESFSLPPGLYIKLVDVNSGSYTPKLVSLVLEWKIRDPINSHRIMSQLAIKNLELKESFKELSFLESSDPEYYNVLDQLSRLSNKTWANILPAKKACKILTRINLLFNDIRSSLREMGNASNAPIEPQSQTALLDCTLDSPGILLAGAPGAGGYDAIFCIGLSIEALDKVDLDVWKNWPGVKALNCKESYDFGLD